MAAIYTTHESCISIQPLRRHSPFCSSAHPSRVRKTLFAKPRIQSPHEPRRLGSLKKHRRTGHDFLAAAKTHCRSGNDSWAVRKSHLRSGNALVTVPQTRCRTGSAFWSDPQTHGRTGSAFFCSLKTSFRTLNHL